MAAFGVVTTLRARSLNRSCGARLSADDFGGKSLSLPMTDSNLIALYLRTLREIDATFLHRPSSRPRRMLSPELHPTAIRSASGRTQKSPAKLGNTRQGRHGSSPRGWSSRKRGQRGTE